MTEQLHHVPTAGPEPTNQTASPPHSRKLRILVPPYDAREVTTIAVLAAMFDISEKQAREWVPRHRLGRKVGGRFKVSLPLAQMFEAGDTGAHDDHAHGDRSSPRVIRYLPGFKDT